jgi:CRISPR-associated protein Csm4
MTKIYKLSLKQKSGLLTELDSDTIFGHFCWRMSDLLGNKKLEEFLELYSKEPIFTISNGFFERDNNIYLPNPLLPLPQQKPLSQKDEKIKQFISYKNSKSLKFLTLDQFNFALKGDLAKLQDSLNSANFKTPKYFEYLRTSVKINRSTLSSEESQLFSYAPMFIEEICPDNNKLQFSNTKTILFIKVLDQSNYEIFDCENIIKEVFYIGYGKKKSSGYGEFEVLNYELFTDFDEPENSNAFITISNYIPSVDDELTDYYYDFKIKYGKYGEHLALSKNPFKKPLVLLLPGSVFITNKQKEFYGRVVQVSDYHTTTIQNGFAFSLKISPPASNDN